MTAGWTRACRVLRASCVWLLPTLACSATDADAVDPGRPAPAPIADDGPPPPAEEPASEPAAEPAPEATPRGPTAPLEMTFVGDVIFGRYRGDTFDPIPAPDHAVFADVVDLLRADVVVGNLETPVVRELPAKSPIGARYKFGASAEHVRHLVDAGFTAMSLANNHAFDLRAEGMRQTPEILAGLGIVPLGAARDEPPAVRLETVEHAGWRVGFVAFTMRRNAPQMDGMPLLPYLEIRETVGALAPEIRGGRGDHDVIVVLVHWGDEYAEAPSYMQTKVARELIDLGADLVIGHHPHVLQAIEDHGDGLVAYSLGNFLFENVQEIPRLTGVLRVRFLPEDRCLERATLHPAYMKRLPVPHPVAARKGMALKVRKRVMELSKPFRTRWAVEGEDLVWRAAACGSAAAPGPARDRGPS